MTSQLDSLLVEAIYQLDVQKLRETLIDLCNFSTESRLEVTRKLLIPKQENIEDQSDDSENENEDEDEDENDDDDDEDEDEESDEEPEPSTKRRKLEPAATALTIRYPICDVCADRYDELENHDEACQTHNENLEQIEEFEVMGEGDGDPWIDEPTAEDGEQWPDYFRWPCCDSRGDAPACVVQRHKPRGVVAVA